ncbi:UDP-N-acetylmuramoylalanyl-D-glutamyl-2,6-diaminopimelate--D-alanyl-D-alanine ligase [Rhizobium leguminosarum bv. trifolii]|uniref:UDP-N-acetylmuramoylalanyl-D-glutamyl-2, 6-diaminopimelate--D-alanyl-D-alanine ligase n=1 Tax=Rhizobium ruizarguesonis TaxID=2081791 RepID=UPI00102F52F2|nr:UDP-N-acetylmuramoylalanyl-D-glutamyl-2,6-diaminopimelate--D-alanyl-D-alanine ligase [Rhizobium ruizarguesonis]MBY5879754.1 UDP-N-acetylmuramoylalanyl-D-glutamyl-2,6-diaminopimelate--D-alanyl-D-alanine ligase [Rhizobium leguminosarum]NKL45214.1 UDP-N-acetylmuramoylalanyl-D-glutamyl-2,6-diaminopimelate--D-alanyl-D-alanine ligase [Rhizobium leguminosarum bv. viciae]QIO42545.1 UDP-N-acetylmuramoylalanyl-D-glutamyl-2,6-diaminopimelate--D-alanyl-D-alanine ligase [Rhizobium leguminosarum bv. trifol
MSWLWTTEDMIAAMAGRPFGTLPDGITGIAIDSRSIAPGEAFFAIKGDRVDGHDYASMAMANGASLLVVSEARLPAMGRLTVPMIVVEDVLAALGRLGLASRERSKAQIIAVTGSVGKTTTKEMLRHVLSPSGKVHASLASFNNHWGVPLTLARMAEDTDYGVFEVGMNHPGEIRPLVAMIRPDVAIITTIAPAHLGNFRNIKEIAAAKAEIFEGLEPGGHVVLNRDNDQFNFLDRTAQSLGIEHIHSFGQHAKAEFRLAEFNGSDENSTLWLTIGGETLEVALGAPGRHIAENALAALGVVRIVGADMQKAIEALATLKPEKGRGKRHRLSIGVGSFTLIDESYNANPASMRAAIALLAASEPTGRGRRIAVLGDMLEMGEYAQKVHTDLAVPLLAAGIEHVWLAGAEIAALKESLPESVHVEYRENTGELTDYVLNSVAPGDVLMVKSSLGIGFGKIVAALLDKFPPFADTQREF